MNAIGWAVVVFAGLGLLAIVLVPRVIIPDSRSAKYDEILRVATTRNSVRGTIAQIVAGLAFVATFVQSSVNYSLDYRQKSELATADQFAKAFSQLKDSADNTWVTIGSFNVLARIAEGEARYRDAAYSAMAQFVAGRSRVQCGMLPGEKGEAGSEAYKDPTFVADQAVRAATRLLLERGEDDRSRRKFDLEGACLANADAWGTRGLSRLFIPGVKMLRISAGETTIVDTDMRGIEAGVVHNANWTRYSNLGTWSLHHEVSPERLARLRANFENAKFERVLLDGAGLEGANLAGASFAGGSRLVGANLELADLTGVSFGDSDLNSTGLWGANIARADFSKVKNLTFEQIRSACVRDDISSASKVSIGPTLPPGMAARVQKEGGIELCR